MTRHTHPSGVPAPLPHPTPTAAAPRGRPLRVLDVTEFYSDTVSGGVKTYLHAKAAGLEALGVHHAAVVPGDANRVEALGSSTLYRIRGTVLPMSRAYRATLALGALREVIARERPDVVEVGSPFLIPHLLRHALDRRGAAGRRVATVGFYHADVVRTFAEPYVPSRLAAPVRVAARMAARGLVRRVYRRFDRTVAASASVAAELTTLGVPRVRCIGLGVDLDLFRPVAPPARTSFAEWGVEPGVPVGIYAGRFCAEKRLDVLLAGHARLPEDRRPHLVLVGGGPQLGLIEEIARRQARVSVLPYVTSRPDLARVLASADFYLAPGPGETFGLSIAEALACGLPVVVVDRGAGVDRLAGSDVGERYHHGDPDSAARALTQMVERLGPDLRTRARAHAEATFDWRLTFERLVDLYRELVPVAA